MALSLPQLLVSLLILLPASAVAQSEGNIAVGNSLTAGNNDSAWLSPSGDFAFGFRELEKKDFFLLCIWFDKIPNKTIVWYANGDNPAPRRSRVSLTADRGLELTGPTGEEIWRPEAILGTINHGVMNNTGNFALKDSESNMVWETFQHPRFTNSSDTLLPHQSIARGEKLSSRQSEANFATGRFQLRLLEDGNLVLNTINLPTPQPNEAYYNSNDAGASNSSDPGKTLSISESGDIYILGENGQQYPLNRSGRSAMDFYFRATLDFDGVFTLYSHPRTSGNGSWTRLWSIPDNICTASRVSSGTSVCGYNSICILTADRRPTCKCPRGYSLLDPSDRYGSCKPDFIQGCEEDKLSHRTDLYEFEELINTDWPFSDYVLLKPSTEELCKKSCMEDCMCAVAIFRAGDSCWKKRLPLSNGRLDNGLNGGKALIKVRKENTLSVPDKELPIPSQEKDKDNVIIIGSVLLGGSGFINVILIAAVCVGFSLIYRKKLQRIITNNSVVDMNLRYFTHNELSEGTDGFKEELGRGALGVVYKGVIQKGSSLLVAVKKLNNLFQDTEKEFKTEVNVIGQTHHKNLVRLLGFCDEGPHRMLVYEFMSNGTLAGLLFGERKPAWNQRIQIAIGIARGLLYLHEECCTQIIHCDIKPHNILLDEYHNARISDFGLAKLLRLEQSQTLTGIRGTKGYVAPEWFRNMAITTKVDVYSYGVVLLEIICCRRSVDIEALEEQKAILTDWAYDCYREGALDALVEFDEQALDDKKNLERFLMVAFWCIQEDPSLRHSMRKVTQMLEGIVEVPIPPCPFFFTK